MFFFLQKLKGKGCLGSTEQVVIFKVRKYWKENLSLCKLFRTCWGSFKLTERNEQYFKNYKEYIVNLPSSNLVLFFIV